MTSHPTTYWKRILGIDLFKVKYAVQYGLYKTLRIALPKLKSQRLYWAERGTVYKDEILASGYLEREVFFQDLLVNELRGIDFQSCFEAGCGFGWNVKRVKDEFPQVRVSGLDFSLSQLINSKEYMRDSSIPVVNGDNCAMPFRDNSFDVGFSVGVFMNIHPASIRAAFREMMRVCRKYIIHLEYDENHTTPALREKRAFKTNIISHDYKALYASLGANVIRVSTYKEFGEAYYSHQEKIASPLQRWEGFEGPEKYILIVIQV